MDLPFSVFSALLVLSAIITGSLALYGWQNRKLLLAQPFTLLMAAATVWALGDAVQSLGVSTPVSVLANTLEYPGIVTVPVAWFVFALCYTGRWRYVTPSSLALLFIVPVITVFLVATNPLHHLYYSGISPALIEGTTVLQYARGPLFLIHIGYTYILSVISFLLILFHYSVQFDRYRGQTLVLLAASFIPFLFNILYIFLPPGSPRIDITPFSFAVMGILIAWGILRYRLLAVPPGMYSTVVRNVPDGIFVVGPAGEIVDLNPAGEEIAGKPAAWIAGKSLQSVLPGLGPEWACGDTIRKEIVITRDRKTAFYDVLVAPLVPEDTGAGCVVTLRDITEQKNATDALETANRKLNLLSSITRHDIGNQLTALDGYLHLADAENANPVIRDHLGKAARALSTIQAQVRFSAQYQDIGVNVPSWQHVGRSFGDAVRHHNAGAVTAGCASGDLEVYADPLFEKTFYNLVDNSLRHGGPGLTRIRGHTRADPGGLAIVYEDDGAGIPGPEKEKIFSHVSGKAGGHGLFLVREILAITGITIAEDGEPGKGARFEIRVPREMYRGDVPGPEPGQ